MGFKDADHGNQEWCEVIPGRSAIECVWYALKRAPTIGGSAGLLGCASRASRNHSRPSRHLRRPSELIARHQTVHRHRDQDPRIEDESLREFPARSAVLDALFNKSLRFLAVGLGGVVHGVPESQGCGNASQVQLAATLDLFCSLSKSDPGRSQPEHPAMRCRFN